MDSPIGSSGDHGVTCRRSQSRKISELGEQYRLLSVVDYVKRNAFKCLALQFTEALLSDSTQVSLELNAMLKAANLVKVSTFVLADKTFSSCCSDEITAQHNNADCIVHFGHACMSRPTTLPVFHVHGRDDHDPAAVASAIREVAKIREDGSAFSVDYGAELEAAALGSRRKREIVLLIGASAEHNRNEILEAVKTVTTLPAFQEDYLLEVARRVPMDVPEKAQTGTSKFSPSNDTSTQNQTWRVSGLEFPQYVANHDESESSKLQHFVLVGQDFHPALHHLALITRFNATRGRCGGMVVVCPPRNALLPSPEAAAPHFCLKAVTDVDRLLTSRNYRLRVAETAQTIGIIVCTLSVVGFNEVIHVLKEAVESAGKRCHVIYMGRLNGFKVANFATTIDAFVVVACPQNHLAYFYTKNDNFIKPLLSPVELLMAMGWVEHLDPAGFTMDFDEVMRAARERRLADPNAREEGANALSTLGPRALGYRFKAMYNGLEPRIGETPVQAKVAQGKSGVARGYTHEMEEL